MKKLSYKLGLRLAQLPFVRSALDDRADLSPFKKRPTFRILFGVFLIGFSFLICWPAITALGTVAVYLKMPLLILIGGPTLYISSYLCFLAGMALSGAKYSRIFLRWLTRIGVEKLLRIRPIPQTPSPHLVDPPHAPLHKS